MTVGTSSGVPNAAVFSGPCVSGPLSLIGSYCGEEDSAASLVTPSPIDSEDCPTP